MRWMVERKPSTKISIGTGMLIILYFVYALCAGGFSFTVFASAAISVVIGAIVLTIVLLAAMMILDGLLGLGE